jgi:isopenicillin N synthase-like dioxygenase
MPDANAIPVIDLGAYLAGDPGGLDHAAVELRHALTEIGFYTIVNHGVPSAGLSISAPSLRNPDQTRGQGPAIGGTQVPGT